MSGILIPIYSLALNSAEDALKKEISGCFYQGISSIGTNLNILDGHMYSLKNTYEVMVIAFKDDTTLNAVNDNYVFDLVSALKNTANANGWHDGLMMMFERNNLLFINDIVYNKGELAFKNGHVAFGDYDYTKFRETIMSNDKKWYAFPQVSVIGVNYNDVLLYTARFNSSNGNGDVMAAFIRAETFRKNTVLPSVTEALLTIQTTDGETLYSDSKVSIPLSSSDYAKKTNIEGIDHFTWSKELSSYGLRIGISVPASIFREYIRPVSRILEILIMLAFLVITITCAFLLWYVFRPLMPILRFLSMEESITHKHRNIFERITQAFKKQEELALNRKNEYNAVYMQMAGAALRHALGGDVLSDSEKTVLSGLNIFAEEYTVAVFRFSKVTEENINKLQDFGSLFFGQAWKEGAVYEQGEFLVVLPSSTFSRADSHKVREQLINACSADLVIGWSLPHTGIDGLPEAAMEARAYAYARIPATAQAIEKCPFSEYAEYDKFIRLISDGDKRALKPIDDMISVLMKGECATAKMIDTIEILKKILALHSDETEHVSSSKALTNLKALRYKAEEIVRLAAIRADSKRKNVSESILEYIEYHLSDTEMSLSSLKEVFGLSENYISMLIKKHTGSTYSAYVTERRMVLAMKLLTTTDLSIDTIVKRVGYFHKNTFYKVFKRTFDNTPSFYRCDE